MITLCLSQKHQARGAKKKLYTTQAEHKPHTPSCRYLTPFIPRPRPNPIRLNRIINPRLYWPFVQYKILCTYSSIHIAKDVPDKEDKSGLLLASWRVCIPKSRREGRFKLSGLSLDGNLSDPIGTLCRIVSDLLLFCSSISHNRMAEKNCKREPRQNTLDCWLLRGSTLRL
jgi:hypothetical protein